MKKIKLILLLSLSLLSSPALFAGELPADETERALALSAQSYPGINPYSGLGAYPIGPDGRFFGNTTQNFGESPNPYLRPYLFPENFNGISYASVNLQSREGYQRLVSDQDSIRRAQIIIEKMQAEYQTSRLEALADGIVHPQLRNLSRVVSPQKTYVPQTLGAYLEATTALDSPRAERDRLMSLFPKVADGTQNIADRLLEISKILSEKSTETSLERLKLKADNEALVAESEALLKSFDEVISQDKNREVIQKMLATYRPIMRQRVLAEQTHSQQD